MKGIVRHPDAFVVVNKVILAGCKRAVNSAELKGIN
jgi:hypothetical protein